MEGEIFSGVAYLVAVNVVERDEPVAQQKPEVVCALVVWGPMVSNDWKIESPPWTSARKLSRSALRSSSFTRAS